MKKVLNLVLVLFILTSCDTANRLQESKTKLDYSSIDPFRSVDVSTLDGLKAEIKELSKAGNTVKEYHAIATRLLEDISKLDQKDNVLIKQLEKELTSIVDEIEANKVDSKTLTKFSKGLNKLIGE